MKVGKHFEVKYIELVWICATIITIILLLTK